MATRTEGLGKGPTVALAALLVAAFSAGGAFSMMGAPEPLAAPPSSRAFAEPNRWIDPGAPPLPEHPSARPKPGTFRYPDGTYEEGGGGMPGRTTAAQRLQIEKLAKGFSGR